MCAGATGFVVGLIELSEVTGLEVVLGYGAVDGDRGVVGGGREPLGVADAVPASEIDETVGGVADLLEGELAAGLVPADLGGECLRDWGQSVVSEPRGKAQGVLQGNWELMSHAEQEQAHCSAQPVRAQRTPPGC